MAAGGAGIVGLRDALDVPDPAPVDLDPLHAAGRALVNVRAAQRQDEVDAAKARADRALALHGWVSWGADPLQIFSGVKIDRPDFRPEALAARVEADRLAATSEGEGAVDRAAYEVGRVEADLREATRYADLQRQRQQERAAEATRQAREAEADAETEAEQRRAQARTLYGDMVASGRLDDATALYRDLNPLATPEQAAAAARAAREAYDLDQRGDRALIEQRERGNRPRTPTPLRTSGGASSGSRGSSTGSGGTRRAASPPPAPPPPRAAPAPRAATVRPQVPGTPTPSMLARRRPDLGDPFASVDQGNPFGAGFADRASVVQALESGPLRDQVAAQAEAILGMPAADRRAALETLLADLDGRPGGDLIEAALFDALGY